MTSLTHIDFLGSFAGFLLKLRKEVFDEVSEGGSRRRHGGRRQDEKEMRNNLGRNRNEYVETPRKNAANAVIALLVLVLSGLVVGIQFFQFEDKANVWLEQQKENSGEFLFTKDILRDFDGSVEGRPIVVCILGSCFNVSAGERFYGKGKHYSCFAGNDGSRAYVTGKFDQDGCIDDLEGLNPGQLITIDGWLKFYHNQTKYKYMGKLVGRYYDTNGEEKEELKTFRKLVAQARHDEIFMKKLPGASKRSFLAHGR
eukprot:766421-Hanusia_phi.AAC.2